MKVKLFIFFLILSATISDCWPDFYFYPKSGEDAVKFETDDLINDPRFDYSKTTSFVVHGFISGYLSPDIALIRSALFNRTDANIIAVDWQVAAGGKIDYPAAFLNMRTVGKNISIFIQNNNIDTLKVLCVGHSLGAHACGFAGKNSLTPIKRIIGLDPAGPLFDLHSPKERLNSTDAKLVDVIHTTKTAGIMYGIGHKDFWPNHGIEQPGCDFYQADCGHQRSIHLFVESTEGEHKFISVKCTDGSNDGLCLKTSNQTVLSMGYFADTQPFTGSFFLTTYAQYPFSKS